MRSSLFIFVLDETLRNCHYVCVTHTHTMGMTCCRMLIQRYMDARRPTKPRLLGRILGDVTQYKARRVGVIVELRLVPRSSSAQSILSLSLTEFYIYFSAFFPRSLGVIWLAVGHRKALLCICTLCLYA